MTSKPNYTMDIALLVVTMWFLAIPFLIQRKRDMEKWESDLWAAAIFLLVAAVSVTVLGDIRGWR